MRPWMENTIARIGGLLAAFATLLLSVPLALLAPILIQSAPSATSLSLFTLTLSGPILALLGAILFLIIPRPWTWALILLALLLVLVSWTLWWINLPHILH